MKNFRDTSDAETGEKLESDRLPDAIGELPESNRLPNEVSGKKIGDFSEKELQRIHMEHPDWQDEFIAEIGTMKDYKAICKVLAEDAELQGLEEKYGKQQITLYKDDKGNLYRVNNTMLPNRNYELNGYRYKTDGLGRRILAEGILHEKERNKRLLIKDRMEAIGQGDEKPTDDRGHLIGDQFDGSNGMENMIPQDSEVNQKDFKALENQLARQVKAGKEVYLKIQPKYQRDSFRPIAIVVTFTIDGKKEKVVFQNGGR